MTVFSTLFVAGCGTTAPHPSSWNPNGTPRNEDWHSPRASLQQFDANHDGILTRLELAAGLRADFATYDRDHNNCLSPDEVRAINQARVEQDASQAVPLVDWNQDGCVDFKEFSGAVLSLFDSLDTNGDGQLTGEELNPNGRHPGSDKPNHQGESPHDQKSGGQGEGDGK